MFRAILKELLISAEVNIHLTFGLGVEMSDLGLVHFFFFLFWGIHSPQACSPFQVACGSCVTLQDSP